MRNKSIAIFNCIYHKCFVLLKMLSYLYKRYASMQILPDRPHPPLIQLGKTFRQFNTPNTTTLKHIFLFHFTFIMLVCKVCAYFREYAKYALGIVRDFHMNLVKPHSFTEEYPNISSEYASMRSLPNPPPS